MSTVEYVNGIFENLWKVDESQVGDVYNDLRSAGAIIPSGEGRSKGALSIACSEMGKMAHGKVVVDRGDIGFPGRDLAEAAPVLRRRLGPVCLLINSSSGKSLMPLLDAQRLAFYLSRAKNARDFRIDLTTSDPGSPLGKLSSKYGNMVVLKGGKGPKLPAEPREFREYGTMEDIFPLSSGLLFHSMAAAMSHEATPDRVLKLARRLSSEISGVVADMVSSDFFDFVLDSLEQRKSCFFAGLGSSREVARMTGVRIGHVKRALGDHIYVSGEAETPAPRIGDILIVVSHSGETEIMAGWCRNFKWMGGLIASVVGKPKSTIESLSDISFVVKSDWKRGSPNSFYIKAAYALSPLPVYLVERVVDKGFILPEYIRRWHRTVAA
ncbi:MAG: hypothetical protein ACE5IB_04970 [Candidatus Geothermarchaeales archaeon]